MEKQNVTPKNLMLLSTHPFLFSHVGITLTSPPPPPQHTGALAPKCVPSSRASAQCKIPSYWAYKWQCSWGQVFKHENCYHYFLGFKIKGCLIATEADISRNLQNWLILKFVFIHCKTAKVSQNDQIRM